MTQKLSIGNEPDFYLKKGRIDLLYKGVLKTTEQSFQYYNRSYVSVITNLASVICEVQRPHIVNTKSKIADSKTHIDFFFQHHDTLSIIIPSIIDERMIGKINEFSLNFLKKLSKP